MSRLPDPFLVAGGGRGASFALAPDRRVGSVLHRRPPVPPTRGRGTFTAGSRHERAEEENGTGSECTSAAGGWRVVDRMRRRVRAPARDKCGFDGCIRVHRCRHEHLGRDDAFHHGLGGLGNSTTSTAAPLCRGSERTRKSPRKASGPKKFTRCCLVNANAHAESGNLHLPRTVRRTPIVLIRPPSAPSDPSPGSAPCRGCCSRTPFRLLLLLPCLLLLRRRPGPRRACRASSLRSYPRTRGRSSFGNCAAGTTGQR